MFSTTRLARLTVLAACLLALGGSAASAHDGNPDFRSVVQGVSPRVPGLQAQVMGYDAQFQLLNRSGRSVVVLGYSGEPYAQLLQDGTVEVNKRSPAYYLNEDRSATTPVPPGVTGRGAPQWQMQDRTGRFIWHDHRMHWMSPVLPPQVKDKSKKTKIFDYDVPLSVSGQPAKLTGTLFWVGRPSGIPGAAVVSLLILALLALGFVVIVRRRRGGETAVPSTSDTAAEAW